MAKQVLVVAAHPDDELLGCGGTIARHSAEGDDVHVLILATGATSRSEHGSEDVKHLQKAAREAATIVGARSPVFGGFSDNRMDEVPILSVIKSVEAHRDAVVPDIVYTHHHGDLNVDHRVTHQAVLTAFRPLPGLHPVDIFAFETLSSSEWGAAADGGFRPQRFVDIAPFMEAKIEALRQYQSELRLFPHARSLEAVRALAVLRGVSVGLGAAEAFTVVREIV